MIEFTLQGAVGSLVSLLQSFTGPSSGMATRGLHSAVGRRKRLARMGERRRGHCVLAVGSRVSCMVEVCLNVCVYWGFG